MASPSCLAARQTKRLARGRRSSRGRGTGRVPTPVRVSSKVAALAIRTRWKCRMPQQYRFCWNLSPPLPGPDAKRSRVAEWFSRPCSKQKGKDGAPEGLPTLLLPPLRGFYKRGCQEKTLLLCREQAVLPWHPAPYVRLSGRNPQFFARLHVRATASFAS